jgi:hypothetical protein
MIKRQLTERPRAADRAHATMAPVALSCGLLCERLSRPTKVLFLAILLQPAEFAFGALLLHFDC